jgi:hypothetical protein
MHPRNAAEIRRDFASRAKIFALPPDYFPKICSAAIPRSS